MLQHSCGTDNWRNVGLTRSKGDCGYQPYTSVTCRVRAKNKAGHSAGIEKTVYTKCAGKN